MANAARVAVESFTREFGRAPEVHASAPGRVNLIGEHTDYNDGFALPMAIDRRFHVAAGGQTKAHALGDARVSDGAGSLMDGERSEGSQFLALLDEELARSHPGMREMACATASDLPVGAGLSSSAALEIAWLRARCAVAGLDWDAVAMARLAQAAETNASGVRCGIMDQLTSAAARRGHAMLLDCRSLETRHVPIPPSLAVVVMYTGTHRALKDTAYNDRRAACEAAVRQIQRVYPSVRALRDATLDMLAAAPLDDVTARRARHVIEENLRPAAMVEALRSSDGPRAGQLMNDSHNSLRNLYEVSSIHLDMACDTAREHPACFGARMTGAGFGGCAIALVRADAVDDFIRFAQPRYGARTYKKSEFFVAVSDDGARLEPSPF